MEQPTDPQRECPLCGDTMRLKRRLKTRLIPGFPENKIIEIVEWECRECDYFEEYTPDDNAAS